MSMKSSGARSRSCSRRPSSGIASTRGTSTALSTSATTSTRPRTAAASRSAGRCDCRAMPPAPITAPRYRFRSGDPGVCIALAVEQVAERAESLEHGRSPLAVEVLRQVQLAPGADADVQEGVAHEVYGGALESVGQSRGGDQQKRARPPEPAVDQPVDEVEVQIDEPEV